MTHHDKPILTAKEAALTAVFAALIVIITRLPGIPIIFGVQKATIEFSVPLYPLAGILLGPWIGALAVLIGNLVSWIIPKTTVFGLLLVPAGAFAALTAGFLTRKSRWANWKFSAITLTLLIILWYTTPVGFEAPFYPFFLHIPALALILIFRGKIFDFLNGTSKKLVTLGVAIASFAGVMADQMWGNLMFITALNFVFDLKAFRNSLRNIGMTITLGFPWKDPFPNWMHDMIANPTLGDLFMLYVPITAIERTIFTIIATIVGVAIIMSVGRIFFAHSSKKGKIENHQS